MRVQTKMKLVGLFSFVIVTGVLSETGIIVEQGIDNNNSAPTQIFADPTGRRRAERTQSKLVKIPSNLGQSTETPNPLTNFSRSFDRALINGLYLPGVNHEMRICRNSLMQIG